MAITRAYKNATNFQERTTATPLIINGDMQIAQRGTSVTGVTSSGYASLDRFKMDMASQGTFTVSQSTDVPTGQGFLSSMKLDCTTADTVLGADNRVAFRQIIEDQNCIPIKKGTANAETLTVAFWVKSNKTGTYVVELYDFANARQVSQSYTIDSANTWEKKVLSYPADTTGTMDNDNTNGIMVQFWITAGTTYTGGTLNTTWNSDTTANRAAGLTVNIADSTSNDFYVTGVQLEVGTFDSNSIPPFQFEDRATSLARCQRYCIVYGTGEESYQQLGETGISTSTTQAQIPFNHPTEMRGVPSLSSSGNLALGEGTSLIAITSVVINSSADTRQSTGVIATVSSGLTAHRPYRIDQQGSSSSTMTFDSEL